MSQSPPPQSPYGSPPPMPVQPIVYGSHSAGGRPGLLTAIGVLSITIGALSILFNAGMGMTTFGVMMASSASRAIAQVTTPSAQTSIAVANDANAMTPRERRAVINGLAKVRTLSPARRRQLDAILIEAGRRMVFGAGPSLTPDVVAANISDHGRVTAAGGEGDEPDFFILGRGRLELFDDRAVFIPQDGTETVRTQAPAPEDGDPLADDLEADLEDAEADSASATQPAGLTPRQLKAVMQHIDSMLTAQGGAPPGKLNAAQAQTLTARFGDQQGGFFSPTPDLAGARAQVSRVHGLPNGAVQISTQLGTIQVNGNGNVVHSFTQASFAAAGAAGRRFQVNEVAVLLSLLGCLAGFILAVALIIAGALVLRQHGTGRKWHVIYAWLKIPLAIGCAFVWVWMFASAYNSVSAAGGGAAPGSWGTQFTIAFIVAAMAGVAYPVGLLFALRTRAVRDYYSSTAHSHADGWRRS